MKKWILALLVLFTTATPLWAVDLVLHGDFNNEFRLYSNQADFFRGDFAHKIARTAAIAPQTSNDSFATIKYRLWTEAASDSGAVKGVFAIEIGGIHYGQNTDSKGNDKGGDFSGDGVNIETRWAYTDFAVAGGRLKVGLQPFNVNRFLWNETATGIDYRSEVGGGALQLAWMRGYEVIESDGDNAFKDLDAFLLRYTLKATPRSKAGFFVLWQTSDAKTLSDGASAPLSNYLKNLVETDLDLYTLGAAGTLNGDAGFLNWDVMVQRGEFAEEYDFGGYFVHLDIGANLAKGKLTYTFWYASGDKNSGDGDLDAFIATDCDTNADTSSIVLFEGYASDDYFSAVPYVQDKGLILNRLGYDYRVSDKLRVAVAALYLMSAEELGNDSTGDGRVDQFGSDKIGIELDGCVSYKLLQNLELAIQFGYLLADDAMDYYEQQQDGQADEDLYVINSKIRYTF